MLSSFRNFTFSMTATALLSGIAAPLSAQSPATSGIELYRDFAMSHESDATVGRRLFTSMACASCHTLDGGDSKVGPDLSSIGDKFDKAALIRAVLEPSADIAVGYSTTVLGLSDGTALSGVIRQATERTIDLMGSDSQLRHLETASVVTRDSPQISIMPQGLQATVSPQEFSDLIAYLGSLRQAPPRVGEAEIPLASKSVRLDSLFDAGINFKEPTWYGEVPGTSDRHVVLEHAGMAWLIERLPSGDRKMPLLDLTGIVRVGGATGLLSLAFHPRFPEDPRYFLNYQIAVGGGVQSLIVERRFAPDLRGDSGSPSREIIRIPGVTQDHNGGCIAFGPDGFLYFGMGDTGPQRDPQGHSQDPGILLGKMCRIDIDHPSASLPYAIPADNPFLGKDGYRPEIWAIGFREPWRFGWDRVTGDLWVGDVGQDRIEEVGIVRSGENHGWNVFEGFQPYSDRYRRTGVKLTPPVWSYPRRYGSSVTGGYVYRGTRAPRMEGWYVFADHESHRIWALTQMDRKMEKIVEIGRAPTRAVSLSQTRDGEIYLVGFDSGKIHRLALETVNPVPLEQKVLVPTSERTPNSYQFTTVRPDEAWTLPEFDDASWQVGPGGFGTQGTPGGNIRTHWSGNDIWLRRAFRLTAKELPPTGSGLVLRIHHDEDAEIYLNGSQISRQGRWTQGYVDLPLPDDAPRLLREGRNVLSIHCHQNGGGQFIDAGLLVRSSDPTAVEER